MKRKLKSLIRPLLICAPLALTGCQVLSSAEQISQTVAPPPQKKSDRVTLEKLRAKDPQSKIGAQAHPRVLAANGGAYQDQRLEEVLALITGKLVSQSNDPTRVFDITILNSSSINAFALPGGYLYITRGLLALANDTSEVAAVLAHEMAHVFANHGVQRSRETQAASIADRVATQVVSNPVVSQITKATTEQRLEAFSKNQELQADAVGIKLMGEASFDPFAAARFLRSMERFSKWRSVTNADVSDISKSHPSTPQRVELAKRHARVQGPPGSVNRNKKRYLAGINGIEFGDSSTQGVIRGNRFYHAKYGFTFEAPKNFDLTNREDAVLVSGPDQMAMRFDAAKKSSSSSSPSAYLKSGWLNGFIEGSLQEFKINGLPAASARAATGDWQFIVTVVELDKRYYRFIMAAPRAAINIDGPGEGIPATFRRTTNKDKASLKPLRIKVIKARATDTIDSMARRMKGVSRKKELFLALNGLDAGQRLQAGTEVKLVTD